MQRNILKIKDYEYVQCLDMDSSVSPTHGEQENSVWNGHYACTCYHPMFPFNQFGDLERCALRHLPAMFDGLFVVPGGGVKHAPEPIARSQTLRSRNCAGRGGRPSASRRRARIGSSVVLTIGLVSARG
jgi:hypothetical protein